MYFFFLQSCLYLSCDLTMCENMKKCPCLHKAFDSFRALKSANASLILVYISLKENTKVKQVMNQVIMKESMRHTKLHYTKNLIRTAEKRTILLTNGLKKLVHS